MGHIREHRSLLPLEEQIMARHVVVGKGAVGTTLASELADQGHDVVVVSRSGAPGTSGTPKQLPADPRSAVEQRSGGESPAVEHHAADIARPGALIEAARGADVIYNCVNPPYHRWATDWPPLNRTFLDAAEASGAVLVTASNLYGHGAGSGLMREDTPLASTEIKGSVRAEMWLEARARHEAGRVRATEVRASDYLGPLATEQAHYGSRLLVPLLAGRTLRVIGDPDQPHAVVYLPDFARALAAAGTTPAAWGHAWLAPHHPATTFRDVARRFAAAAGVDEPRISPLPGPLLAVAATVSPMMREVRRVSYQFTQPFEVDSSASERVLAVAPTPWPEIVDTTLAWWRAPARTS